MLYVLKGNVEVAKGDNRSEIEQVEYIAALRDLYIDGDYINYAGIPVSPVSLNKLDDVLLEDRSYRDFLEHASKVQSVLNRRLTEMGPSADHSVSMLLSDEIRTLESRLQRTLKMNFASEAERGKHIAAYYTLLNEASQKCMKLLNN